MVAQTWLKRNGKQNDKRINNEKALSGTYVHTPRALGSLTLHDSTLASGSGSHPVLIKETSNKP